MVDKNKKKSVECIQAFAITFIFYLITHGYRFANNLFTSDSLVSVFQDDIYWQRSIGRFMQPYLIAFRGSICAPWLIFFFSFIFIGISAFLIFEILGIKRIAVKCAVCGVLVCNATWTSAVAAYLPWVDVYAIALALAVTGVWLYKRDDLKGYIFGSICFVLCMGFYQAYIDVALAMIFMMSIVELATKGDGIKKNVIIIIKRLGGLAVSGGGYYGLYHLVCKIHHVTLSTTYNGLDGVGNYAGQSVGSLVVGTYREIADWLMNQYTFASTYLMGTAVSSVWRIVLRVCAIICILMLVAGLIYINKKNKSSGLAVILQILGCVTMPFAVNFVYFMSKGMEHPLMILSFSFIYIFVLYVMEICFDCISSGNKVVADAQVETAIDPESKVAANTVNEEAINAENRALIKKDEKIIGTVWFMLPIALLIWSNIVYSNQIYFKVDMQDRAALSTATRLINDIEDVEEYEPGVTPVVFIGSIEYSANDVVYLRDIEAYGVGRTPFNYETFSLRTFINIYLNSNMVIEEISREMTEFADEWSIYPKKDAIRYIDGKIYVKLSE